MEITLKRVRRNTLSTIGELSIDGTFECYTMEDTDRGLKQNMPLEDIKRIKVKGTTCIPAGRYRIIKVWWTKHNAYYLQLQGVPGYVGIFIHTGNTNKDTEGCLLPGRRIVNNDFVADSRVALSALNKKVFPVLDAGKEVWITIT